MLVLVCEDDRLIREGLVELLQEEGYQTEEAVDGEQALEKFRLISPQFVILDVMMPGISGYDVCREIRKDNTDIPIMFISAKSEEVDRVLGLELGADDYIVKPFGVHEVISRIRAITRRIFRGTQDTEKNLDFSIGEIQVQPKRLLATHNGQEIELNLRDIKLLKLFATQPGVVIDRDTIFNQCWAMNYLPNSRTLDQHISKLRKKLGDDPKNPKLIETVHGVGYRYPKETALKESLKG